MKILSIGNSFSTDAQRYIHKISLLAKNPIKTVNLYIGGCSLRTHYINMLENAKKYDFQFNGESTGLPVTIKDALISDDWDYVTLQQASHYSTNRDSYVPYITHLADYVKKYAPKAKIIIHQTWQYDEAILAARKIAETPEKMFMALKDAYDFAAKEINADGIIPTGEAVAQLIKNGITAPHRDGFHLSLGEGRLLASLLWYCYLTKENPEELQIPTLDTEVSEENIKIIKKTVKEVLYK
ncbi:MAG: DUF4886 domain-containing protein [Clostridia bacterium]|nr:DUF4886 domain-containing protein [Clostridia bacterium]